MVNASDESTSRMGRGAVDAWIEAIYDDLRGLAQAYLGRSGPVASLQPTALVHESYLRLLRQDRTEWREPQHVVAVGAQVMRRVLADELRASRRAKRGGRLGRVQLVEELALAPEISTHDDLDAALTELAALDRRQADVVELRFFSGMTMEAVAATLGVSKRTVEADWTLARAWLRRALTAER